MRLYVGGIPWKTTDDDLRKAFEEYGRVTSAKVITDKETGRSRGFGFVEMSEADATAALKLDGTQMGGRTIKVNEAKEAPKRERNNR
jgi:RNA recognition motif-containing protein